MNQDVLFYTPCGGLCDEYDEWTEIDALGDPCPCDDCDYYGGII